MSPGNTHHRQGKMFKREETRQERRARETAEAKHQKKIEKLKSDFVKAKRTGNEKELLRIRDKIRRMKNNN
ncbi:hypothetical protein [Zunongwangia profunda]|uniref:hypothetical protein n=1 Tax=Zunongwangia profunda TaxID=398743 RepID=UPI001D193569|nr:hypothetical protein [Zunongwangia profunda]MCC4228406.1 hypothetical protein [Zunongwangia profunda]